MAKNKEMKDSLKKFREEAQKLEQSEALQKARLCNIRAVFKNLLR
jgi:import inner membrane translocase subunit TIM44